MNAQPVYQRKYNKTFFGINSIEKFEQVTGLKVIDLQTELRICRLVTQNTQLTEEALIGVLQAFTNSQNCPYCGQHFV